MPSEPVSELFDPAAWRAVDGFDFTDITYHRARRQGTVRIAFHRPEVRNAFRPHTVDELYAALDHARMSTDVGCVLLTGNGPSPRDGGWAFCSGGDQRIRGRAGYQYAQGETADTVDKAKFGRLHILECQRLIRFMPKIVLCVVPGWAAGGGHSLHVVADLTIASREHARFKQTDADVGSFDGGYGSAYLAKQVGQKFAREVFFLGRPYTAEQEDLARELLPDLPGEVRGAEAAVEAADVRIGLLEPCVLGAGEGQVRHDVQAVPAAGRPAGDDADHDLGHEPDQALGLQDVEPAHRRRPRRALLVAVAVRSTDPLVAARAERPAPVPG